MGRRVIETDARFYVREREGDVTAFRRAPVVEVQIGGIGNAGDACQPHDLPHVCELAVRSGGGPIGARHEVDSGRGPARESALRAARVVDPCDAAIAAELITAVKGVRNLVPIPEPGRKEVRAGVERDPMEGTAATG